MRWPVFSIRPIDDQKEIGPASDSTGAHGGQKIRNAPSRAYRNASTEQRSQLALQKRRRLWGTGGIFSLLLSFTDGKDELKPLDVDMNWVVEPGKFEVIMGGLKKSFDVASA